MRSLSEINRINAAPEPETTRRVSQTMAELRALPRAELARRLVDAVRTTEALVTDGEGLCVCAEAVYDILAYGEIRDGETVLRDGRRLVTDPCSRMAVLPEYAALAGNLRRRY
jgi:hypothetical protein